MSKPSTFTSVFSRSPVITTANIVQSANSLEVSPSKDKPINVSLSATEYDKFLQYQATQQSSHGNSVACLSQTLLTLGFLILVHLITYLDRRTGQTIGTGRESQGLYHLTTQPTSSVACSTDVSPILIHNRLGHPSLSKLQKMVSRLSSLSSLNCESYKNRYYISADVTFFEEFSFFSSTIPESPSISEALPVPYLGPNDYVSSAPLPDLPAYTVDVLDDSPSVPTPSRVLDPASPPILQRDTRSTRNPYPIYIFLSSHHLSSLYYAFVSSLSSISVPKSTSDALAHPGWQQAMIDEMNALHTNGTWELVSLPSGKSTVGCKWVYTVKVHPDGSVDRLKDRLVAKGYTQVYGVDYSETFSPVAKITSVRVFISLVAIFDWPFYQLDIKKAFLHGDLDEEVFMEQPPGFVA
ncbi:Retrovirus-related Pol polyprotein from transposon TNT 1-94 [Quillaja saponaria]|uniref:Retrovirus-related Pol polyprotein from transposon TNT 1-94 n=1 Tax=Quillaja saponaria TaxID=32244 RepID=A0AAD7LJS2_QUISA|nr:Retrovirus-related Pol polyprotein from transposon TNT 1-94 [Quillaja saponaria]